MSYRVTASGNLVADPMLKFTEAGNAVCNFRIACSTGKDKPATFKDCVAFSYVAENFGATMLKGDRAIVSGRVETSNWEKDGKQYSRESLIAEDCGPSLMFATAEIIRKKKEDYDGDNKSSGQQNIEGDIAKSDNPF